MKTLLRDAALKIIENNFSDDVILRCTAVIKEAFIMQGFDTKTANEFAIDGMKITLRTISKMNVA
jgi:hypothetical protein